jgi:hypothetical protein
VLHDALSLPTSVVICGIDSQQVLDQDVEAVKSFRPLDRQQVAALLAKTKDAATAGKFELFKTRSHFDTTARHPDWLGGDTPAVQSLAPQSAGNRLGAAARRGSVDHRASRSASLAGRSSYSAAVVETDPPRGMRKPVA